MSSLEQRWSSILDEIEALDIFPDVDMAELREDMFGNDMYYRFIFKQNKDLGIRAIDAVFDSVVEDEKYYNFSQYIDFMVSEDYSDNKDKAIKIAYACFEIAKKEEDCDAMKDFIEFLNDNSIETDELLAEAKGVCPDDEYEWE
jgi:hypothetical protein